MMLSGLVPPYQTVRPPRLAQLIRIAMLGSFLAAAAIAQFSSAIQGTVSDASQAAVPSATVTVTNAATGVSRQSNTSPEGFYRVPNLGPGEYTVVVEKAGFATAKRQQVNLGITEVVRVDLTLNVGSVAERVDVTAHTTMIETEQGRVTGRIDQMQLKELPLNGRNVLNLLALQPGITGRGISAGFGAAGGGSDSFSGETGPQVYASGQRWENNNYSVDDTSTNGVARNGVTNLTPNSESVEEVRVTSNNFSAVDGRNPGAQVQVITKGGTNQFHGSGSWYHQNNHLAARNIFESKVPVVRRNLYGYSIGGPIRKDRTFFFNSFEGIRQSGTRAAVYSVETPAFRDLVARTRPNSIAANILQNYQPAANPTSGIRDLGSLTGTAPDGVPDIGNVEFVPQAYRNGSQFSVRVDHELRPGKDRIYANYFRTVVTTMNGGIRPQFNRPTRETTYYGNINHTHVFSPTMLNEFRAGVMQLLGRPDQFPDRQALLAIPNITITGITGYGVGGYPNGWWQTNYTFKDVFSWIKNTHTVKTGFEFRPSNGSAKNTTNYIPSYAFSNALDFGNDNPLQMTRLVNPLTGQPATVFSQLQQREWALFVQDDWKVRRNLTLNIGLRYENFGTFKDKEDRLRALTFGPGSDYFARLAAGRVGIVDRFNPADKNNFAPRFGLAWDIGGKGVMTLRAGYGLAYDRLMNLPAETYRSSPPLRATANLGRLFGSTFTYSLGDPAKPFLGYPVDPALQLGLDERGGIRGTRVAITTVDPNLLSPYVHNFFFGLQRQVGPRTMVEANYIGSSGHHLINAVNINRFAGDMVGDNRFDGINPSFAAINMVQATSTSNFHGLATQVRHQLQRGVSIQAAYTFGRAIDDTDQAVGVTNWQNAWDRRNERALAGYDARQKLSLVGVWELPFFRANKTALASRLLGGWQFSGFMILQSGSPMTVVNGAPWPAGDYNGDNNAGDRPDAPPNPLRVQGWSRQEFLTGIFKTTDFPRPAPGRDGTLGRNTYMGPGFAETNFSLLKRFAVVERVNGEFRVDAFNALNRVNLGNPNLDLSSATFGRATSASTPRVFQLGLRFSF